MVNEVGLEPTMPKRKIYSLLGKKWRSTGFSPVHWRPYNQGFYLSTAVNCEFTVEPKLRTWRGNIRA
jgi:hypothetical protein